MIKINPEIFLNRTSLLTTFLASFLIWVMLGGLVFLWIIDKKRRKEQVLHAIFSIIVAWVITFIIKSLLPIERPFIINSFPPLTFTTPVGSSFPSSHTAVSFAMALSIWLHKKKIGWLFLFASFLVGIGRILANVHYFIDIVGGAVIGIVSSYTLFRVHLYKLLK